MKPIFYTKHTIGRDDIRAVEKILAAEWLTQGKRVFEFESKIARYCGARYAVAVNSGTSALHLATFAAGIQSGDEVITTPLSFAATANCILYEGGFPIFADVDYETGLLDPEEVEKKITDKTKAVITVDYAGHPSFFRELKRICKDRKLVFIDDAVHSLGALYHQKLVGTQADMTVFSFHPAKLITTGEGGMLLTDNKSFYERALLLRNHGITKEPKNFVYKSEQRKPWYFEMQELGYNYRITDFQCMLGLTQFQKISGFLKKRRELAHAYTKLFEGDKRFRTPKELAGCESAWHLYPIRIRDKSIDKEKIFQKCKEYNIFPQVHYIPIHTHPYYQKNFGYRWGDFPKAEAFYEEEISIPLYPTLRISDVEKIAKIVRSV
ncbi:MAG: UDP-4-amino-4,6-dideoxy-N-acetyl-beta-L-altrosamine transaminase [Candidatus Spechtbacteria bacterium]|nr:UDP-4-amino-4,6-dideoxy-N-acetyl-beta-L-altrosamine transaminase [Candidatus Spechtbacteria bacterium]